MRRSIAATVAVVSLLLLFGCSPSSKETKPVQAAAGAEGTQTWKIMAWKYYNGRLCLQLRPSGGRSGDETGGCQFDGSSGAGRMLSWDADDGAELVFGPVPPAATTVQVAGSGDPLKAVSTMPLPAGAAKGRLFVARLPAPGYPSDFTAFDAAGHELAKANF